MESRRSISERPRQAEGRLLVVDDEPAMRRALTRELCPEFRVVLARGLSEALAHIDAAADLAAVVSDLMLGQGPDGLRLLAEARERRPFCARILVSSTTDRLDFARQSGLVDAIVAKPWAPRAVLQVVRDLTRARLARGGT
jgi:DNA-binding NtrC family response regulator